MNIDTCNRTISRVFFFTAFVLLVIAVADRFVNFFGYTILTGGYTAGRVLEFAALMLIVVIALLLRQIREELKSESR